MKKFCLFMTIGFFSSLSSLIVAETKAQERYEHAYSLQLAGSYYYAIEEYQTTLKDNPSYNLIYQRLAECFYALDEYDRAYDFVLKALSFKKNDTALESLKAFILIGLEKLEEAKAIFNAILREKPNEITAKFGLAELEIAAGRITVAASIYKEILSIRTENKKALLAMALIEYQGHNVKNANKYIKSALKFHGNDEVTSFFAAYINTLQGKYEVAEAYLDTALKINSDYDDALALLSTVLYEGERYFEVIKIADKQIAKNKKSMQAWYVKTLALLKLGRTDEALQCAKITLALKPENEISRFLLEEIASDALDFEDGFRKELAKYHSEKANAFNNKNESEKAFYEYRRALKMNPYDVVARESYAKILLRWGYPERYLEELRFIKSNGTVSKKIEDALESYGKILEGSLVKKWEIDPLFLDKNHTSISLFFNKQESKTFLPDTGRLAINAMKDVFSYNQRLKISVYEDAPTAYTQAFRMAREKGDDYFGLIKVLESKNDLTLTMELYVARTGALAKTFNVYRSDNDRYTLAIRRLSTMLNSHLPTIGVILKRWQHSIVMDIGKDDFIKDEMDKNDTIQGDFIKENRSLEIVDKSKVKSGKDSLSVSYDEDAVLGYVDISKIEEDVSEGTIRERGFYDKINVGDYVVVKKKEEGVPDEVTLKGRESSYLLYLIRKIRGYLE